MMFDDEHIPLL